MIVKDERTLGLRSEVGRRCGTSPSHVGVSLGGAAGRTAPGKRRVTSDMWAKRAKVAPMPTSMEIPTSARVVGRAHLRAKIGKSKIAEMSS